MLIFFFSISSYAHDRIGTDRPDQTVAATLTPAHYFQAEFGVSHIQDTKNISSKVSGTKSAARYWK